MAGETRLLVVTVATNETDGFMRYIRSSKKYGYDVKVGIFGVKNGSIPKGKKKKPTSELCLRDVCFKADVATNAKCGRYSTLRVEQCYA